MNTLRGNNTLGVSNKLNKAKAILSNIRHDIDSVTCSIPLWFGQKDLFILKKKALTRNNN